LPKAPVQPAIIRDICLVGYASLVSGRAEDLRMSALALGRHGRRWALLDRLSGEITTDDSRPAAVFAEPPRINLLHLHADTAFFDYLFLRERGIERTELIDGLDLISRSRVAKLFGDYEQVWHW